MGVDGDPIQPRELVVPLHEGTYVGVKGEIFLSGFKLWVNVDGSAVEVVTSA